MCVDKNVLVTSLFNMLFPVKLSIVPNIKLLAVLMFVASVLNTVIT